MDIKGILYTSESMLKAVINKMDEMEQIKTLQDNYIQCLSSETDMTKRQIQSLINRKVNVFSKRVL